MATFTSKKSTTSIPVGQLPIRSSWFIGAVVAIIGLYLVTHLFGLTKLPIFADEAIYLRWSQLIIDDWRQYAFFPLNDGKTPLQMWLSVPFLFMFADPLFAGRLVSVIAGLVQVGVIGFIVHRLGGRPKTVLLSMLLVTVLPYWYFHHRMALLDGLMTLWVSLAVASTLLFLAAYQQRTSLTRVSLIIAPSSWLRLIHPTVLIPLVTTGFFVGLALLTKVPAILCLPALLLIVLHPKVSWSQRVQMSILLGGSILIGLAMFLSLKLHPAFSQLFSRGSDFLYPWQEVLFEGKWRQTITNLPTYLSYFGAYLTWPVLILAAAGLFSSRHQRTIHVFFWSGLLFALPIMALGLVVYPRYLFPTSLFLTVAASLSIEGLINYGIYQQRTVLTKTFAALILATLFGQAVTQSYAFIAASLFTPDQIPFVAADHVQYHHEWSSGHGMVEVVALIQQLAQDHTVAVATEGSFGTLPDAILLYLHNQDVSNIFVEGIGYPVKAIPDTFMAKTSAYQQTLLVVNSHRRELDTSSAELLLKVCRPDNAPCLEVWDVSTIVKTPPTRPIN